MGRLDVAFIKKTQGFQLGRKFNEIGQFRGLLKEGQKIQAGVKDIEIDIEGKQKDQFLKDEESELKDIKAFLVIFKHWMKNFIFDMSKVKDTLIQLYRIDEHLKKQGLNIGNLEKDEQELIKYIYEFNKQIDLLATDLRAISGGKR